MSRLSPVGPFHSNATWLPSGDRLGSRSKPGYAVSGTAPASMAGLAAARDRYPAPSQPRPASVATTTAAPASLRGVREEWETAGSLPADSLGFRTAPVTRTSATNR